MNDLLHDDLLPPVATPLPPRPGPASSPPPASAPPPSGNPAAIEELHELVAAVARQLDPDDAASPVAQLAEKIDKLAKEVARSAPIAGATKAMLTNPLLTDPKDNIATRAAAATAKLEEVTQILASSASERVRNAEADAQRARRGVSRAALVTTAATLLLLAIGAAGGYGAATLTSPDDAQIRSRLNAATAQNRDIAAQLVAAHQKAEDAGRVLAAIAAGGNQLQWFYDCPPERQLKNDPRFCVLNRTQPFAVPAR